MSVEPLHFCRCCGVAAEEPEQLYLLPYAKLEAQMRQCRCDDPGCGAVVMSVAGVPPWWWEGSVLAPQPQEAVMVLMVAVLCPGCWEQLGSAEERWPYFERTVAAWHATPGAGTVLDRAARSDAVRAAVERASSSPGGGL